VAPGYVESEMTQEIPRERLDAFIAARSPLARLGLQQELDSTVVFLASPASGYITGSTIAVDDGMSGH
jgi:NAD(P)-dependent dehydrogenase (short-subunit alcohol dehydrogenase family)